MPATGAATARRVWTERQWRREVLLAVAVAALLLGLAAPSAATSNAKRTFRVEIDGQLQGGTFLLVDDPYTPSNRKLSCPPRCSLTFTGPLPGNERAIFVGENVDSSFPASENVDPPFDYRWTGGCTNRPGWDEYRCDVKVPASGDVTVKVEVVYRPLVSLSFVGQHGALSSNAYVSMSFPCLGQCNYGACYFNSAPYNGGCIRHVSANQKMTIKESPAYASGFWVKNWGGTCSGGTPKPPSSGLIERGVEGTCSFTTGGENTCIQITLGDPYVDFPIAGYEAQFKLAQTISTPCAHSGGGGSGPGAGPPGTTTTANGHRPDLDQEYRFLVATVAKQLAVYAQSEGNRLQEIVNGKIFASLVLDTAASGSPWDTPPLVNPPGDGQLSATVSCAFGCGSGSKLVATVTQGLAAGTPADLHVVFQSPGLQGLATLKGPARLVVNVTATPTGGNKSTASQSVTLTPQPSISSIQFLGTPTNPSVIVRGSNLGSLPKPDPAYHPAGHSGCPVIANDAGYDYGTSLYLAATSKNFAGGRYRPEVNELDCIDLVVTKFTTSEVDFHLGPFYARFNAQFSLDPGTAVQMTVNGATLATTVKYA
jgi:hypothetical protein